MPQGWRGTKRTETEGETEGEGETETGRDRGRDRERWGKSSILYKSLRKSTPAL